MSTKPTALDICSQIEDQAKQLLKDMYAEYQFSFSPCDSGEIPIYGYYLALVLIHGTDLIITLRTYYDPGPIAALAANQIGIGIEDVTDHLIKDFVREFSNVLSARLKGNLNRAGIPTVASIPVTGRGIDELFFGPPKGNTKSDGSVGRFSWDKGSFVLSIHTELRTDDSEKVLRSLRYPHAEVKNV